MPEQGIIENLSDHLKQYASTSFELVKLETIANVSVVSSSVISYFLVGLVGSLFLFFMSLGLGFYISFRRGDSYSGFVIVAAFYFLLFLIFLIFRKNGIANLIRDKIIQKMLE